MDAVIVSDNFDPDIEKNRAGININDMAATPDNDVRIEKGSMVQVEVIILSLDGNGAAGKPCPAAFDGIPGRTRYLAMKYPGIIPQQIYGMSQEGIERFNMVFIQEHSYLNSRLYQGRFFFRSCLIPETIS
ncbi:MAG: hypothetical protein II874_08470 [Bacteroidales bacterium]|nr:hypothetical protein [Bacteroidales bacterium]